MVVTDVHGWYEDEFPEFSYLYTPAWPGLLSLGVGMVFWASVIPWHGSGVVYSFLFFFIFYFFYFRLFLR